MSIHLFYAVVAALWLFSFVAGLLALRWCVVPGRRRFRAALVSSCLAIAASYLGLARFHFTASQTTNGRVDWSINSKWFFLASLLLGAASLIWTLWTWKKGKAVAPESVTNAPPFIAEPKLS
jgi:hypothetical protein